MGPQKCVRYSNDIVTALEIYALNLRYLGAQSQLEFVHYSCDFFISSLTALLNAVSINPLPLVLNELGLHSLTHMKRSKYKAALFSTWLFDIFNMSLGRNTKKYHFNLTE